MENNKRLAPREPRLLVDKFKINDRDVEKAVVKGLGAEGFDVDIVPGIKLVGAYGEPVPSGSIITVHRRGKTCTNRK